jgi:hypothetical protein
MSIGHGKATEATRGATTASDELAAFMARVVPWPEEADDGFINIHWLRPDGGGGMPGHAVRTID